MTRRSYSNPINPVETNLAIEQIIIAEYPTTFTRARVDLDALPSGFYDLGSVVEDTPMVRVTRTKFSLEVGLPKIRQFEAVTGFSAQLQFTLNSNSWRKVQVAFGNYTAASSAVACASVSSVFSDGLTFVLSSTPTTPFAVGQQIIISSPGGQDAIDGLEVVIASITTGNLVYSLAANPYKSITAGLLAYAYSGVTQVLGGPRIRYFHVLGIADFLDGVQVIHDFAKMAPAEDWEEKFTPDQNGRIPITMNALGFNTTIGSCSQQVVGLRHYLPPLSTGC